MRLSPTLSLLAASAAWSSLADAGEESSSTADARLGAAVVAGVGDGRGWLGRTDGATLETGFAAHGSLVLEDGPSSWASAVAVAARMGPAPESAELTALGSEARVETRALHRAWSWFGPYLRAGMRASLLRASDVRDAPVVYAVARDRDHVEHLVASRLALTDALAPVTLHQSAGAALLPVRLPPVAVEIRGGVAGRETFADGQRVLDDDPATRLVEAREAEDALQLGGCVGLSIAGAIEPARTRYRLGIEVLAPVLGPELDPGELTETAQQATFEIGLAASVTVVPGLALGYEVEALREPFVLDTFQSRTAVFVSFGAWAGSGPPPL
jgi:hypothetical protein